MIRDKCWLYAGNTTQNGYGIIRSEFAHRFMYRHLVSEIPQGLQLDHLCEVKLCINPEHLEPVTRLENMRRHFAKHPVLICDKGHKLTKDNVRTALWKGKKTRRCLTCAREYARVWQRKRYALSHG